MLTATDEDLDQTLKFTLLSHEDLFDIVSGNQLVTKTALNYEMTPVLTVTVEAADSAVPPAQVTFFSPFD